MGGALLLRKEAPVYFKKKMLYIVNTHDAQAVFIPRNYDGDAPADLSLQLRSTVDLTTPLTCGVLDLAVSLLYYNVAFVLPEDIADGEYRYELTGGGQTLSSGLAYIGARPRGEAPAGTTQWGENITYKQYDGE